MTSATDVLIVDPDHDLVRALQELLANDGLESRAFPSAEALLQECRQEGYCAVLDVRLPGMSGLALQEHLLGRGGEPPAVIVTGATTVSETICAFHQGAFRVLQKPIQPGELLSAVRDAIALAISRRSAETSPDVRLAALTAREREVLQLLVQDKSTKQVARELAISSSTVEKHRTKILTKMRVNSIVGLAKIFAPRHSARVPAGHFQPSAIMQRAHSTY